MSEEIVLGTVEKKKRIASYRLYWNHPRLISQLSEQQRKKVKEKFFKLVEKGRKQNAERISMYTCK